MKSGEGGCDGGGMKAALYHGPTILTVINRIINIFTIKETVGVVSVPIHGKGVMCGTEDLSKNNGVSISQVESHLATRRTQTT